MQEYVGPTGTVGNGTQTAYVLALHMGLLPEHLRAQAATHLVEALAREDWHLGTGFVGVGYLMPVLSSNGYSDVAYRLLEQRSFPSWLYTVDRGATTIWERWDGWTDDNGFQSALMNSFNHYALGSVGEWLYRFVLGIELAPGAAGFDRVEIRPHPGGSLSYARGSFRSVRGRSRRRGHATGPASRWRSTYLPMSGPVSTCLPLGPARSWVPTAPAPRSSPTTRAP